MAEDTKPATTNGYDPEKTQSYVSRIENLHADLDSERGKYMAACRPVHDDIKEVYAEAKEEGFSARALKAVVKSRLLEKKAAAQRDDLDGEEVDNFDNIRLALGDLDGTPLGNAALENAA